MKSEEREEKDGTVKECGYKLMVYIAIGQGYLLVQSLS